MTESKIQAIKQGYLACSPGAAEGVLETKLNKYEVCVILPKKAVASI